MYFGNGSQKNGDGTSKLFLNVVGTSSAEGP